MHFLRHSVWLRSWTVQNIDVKNVFLTFFYSCHVFNVFYFVNVFIFLKTFIENSIKKFAKHFWNHRNEFIGLDFIIKVAGWLSSLPMTYRALGCDYSDTASVTSCSRQSQYLKLWIATNWIKLSLSLVPTFSYTAPTALLGIRQRVEQIRANVFYATFLTFFIFF